MAYDPVAVSNIISSFYISLKQLKDPPVEPDPFDKPPPRNVRGFHQDSEDVQYDSPQTARDIGSLTRGKTRLNVISALTQNDLVDFYSFKVTQNEKVGLSFTSDSGVHVQLIKPNGVIVADSEASYGEKADNYTKLGASRLELEKGTYYLKVTRPTGTDRSVKPNYAIQLSASQYYEQDYETVEKPTPKSATYYTPAGTQSASALGGLLSLFNGNFFDFKT